MCYHCETSNGLCTHILQMLSTGSRNSYLLCLTIACKESALPEQYGTICTYTPEPESRLRGCWPQAGSLQSCILPLTLLSGLEFCVLYALKQQLSLSPVSPVVHKQLIQ